MSGCVADTTGKNILAIHSVGHSAMAWDAVTEVFDVKCSFESRGKEASERSHQRCKEGEQEKVNLVRSIRDGLYRMSHLPKGFSMGVGSHNDSTHQHGQAHRDRWPQIKLLPHKNWVGLASHPTPSVDAEILNGAYHVVETHEIGSP
jgi:hypothetical protein